ncbi:cysteine proteinase inhibitor 1-like [Arachis stenosperma]|uniref:cysteine proteinase inhibitor 1-like n=1 Tax=Arachis stenosperma TaxID=217475 RepID=UPI0025AD73DD|nr:cysteine proteinase inhibitor 1-like [Arachis stenosperma]
MAITRPHHVIILSVLLFASISAFAALVGGWTPIKDLQNNHHVAEIADYAVSEYDRRSGAKLKLVKIVKGESQVVAGTNYRLVLKATDGSKTQDYQAVVWEKPWEHFKNLTSFTLLH